MFMVLLLTGRVDVYCWAFVLICGTLGALAGAEGYEPGGGLPAPAWRAPGTLCVFEAVVGV